MSFRTDPVAKDIALHRWVLPECLHVPTAAVDEAAIATYIGDIVSVVAKGTPNKALLVKVKVPPPIDKRLPIWGLEASAVFHQPMQVWVHIGYGRYRPAYRRAVPDDDIAGKVLSHTMNRRVSALMGFQYVRITVVSRGANSSSGFAEQWGVALRSGTDQADARRGAFIQYADLTGLMLMMDMKLGGGVMDLVNEGQRLVRAPG